MRQNTQKPSLKMWRWGNDKFATGYRIFTLFHSKTLGIDLYLFRYPEGSFIPKHKDPKTNGPTTRINLELRKAQQGGVFKCKRKWSLFDRLHVFRADRDYHSVSKIEKGSRWVLSLGIANVFRKPQ